MIGGRKADRISLAEEWNDQLETDKDGEWSAEEIVVETVERQKAYSLAVKDRMGTPPPSRSWMQNEEDHGMERIIS